MTMRNRRAGVTLLEVLIAGAILVIVVAVTMSILSSGTSTASTGRLQSELEQRGNRTLAFLRDQISTAALTQSTYGKLGMGPWLPAVGTGSQYLAIGYQISGQTNVPAAGQMPHSNITFGYPNPFPPVGSIDPTSTNQSQAVVPTYACFIRFEADTVYMEGPNAIVPTQAANWTDPALPAFPSLADDGTGQIVKVLNMSIHGDNVRTSTYVSGKLMKYIVDETNSTIPASNLPPNCVVVREKLDDQVIMRVNSANAGDFQGNMDRTLGTHYLFCYADTTGTANPALTLATAAGVKVDLWHGCLDQDGKRLILRNNSIFIHFRSELRAGN
jgi:hypothetical protein